MLGETNAPMKSRHSDNDPLATLLLSSIGILAEVLNSESPHARESAELIKAHISELKAGKRFACEVHHEASQRLMALEERADELLQR